MRGGGSLEESHSYVSDIFGMWHVSVTLVSMTTGDRFNKWSSPMSWNHRIKISSVFGGKDLILTECWLILLTMCLKEVLKEACVCVCVCALPKPYISMFLLVVMLRSIAVYMCVFVCAQVPQRVCAVVAVDTICMVSVPILPWNDANHVYDFWTSCMCFCICICVSEEANFALRRKWESAGRKLQGWEKKKITCNCPDFSAQKN